MRTAAQLPKSASSPNNSDQHPGSPKQHLQPLLHQAQSLNPHAWALTFQPRSPAPDLSHRTHIAFAHRAAVCIYLSRLLLSLEPDDPDARKSSSLESLASEAIGHMTHIRPCDALFTATTWPAFIAGAETNDAQKQACIAKRFAEIWKVDREVRCCQRDGGENGTDPEEESLTQELAD